MQCRKPGFRPPILQPNQGSQSHLPNARCPQTVGGFQAVTKVGFSPKRVVLWISGLLVGLLINVNRVQAGLCQTGVVVRIERLNLQGQLTESGLQQAEDLFEISSSSLLWRFSGHQKKVTKGFLFNGADLCQNFFFIEHLPPDWVASAETAVNTAVFTEIGQIERQIQLHGATKTPTGQRRTLLRHRLQKCIGSRCKQSLEIFQIGPVFPQSPFYLCGDLTINGSTHLLPVVTPQLLITTHGHITVHGEKKTGECTDTNA